MEGKSRPPYHAFNEDCRKDPSCLGDAPSVLFEAVAVILSDESAKALSNEECRD
jgi:hypothetical protein